MGTRGGRSEADFRDRYAELFVLAERSARRVLGDVHDAEDVAAETMAKALVSWRRIAGHARPWVVRCAANAAIDRVRRKRVVVAEEAVRGPDEAVVRRVDLLDELRRLPTRQREVLVARYLLDLPDGEIAELLGVGTETVRTHTRRGLAALRRGIERQKEELDDVRR